MTQDISGFGAIVTLIASNTFPNGITISQFADDGDSINFSVQKIADTAMGMNGNLVAWAHAEPISMDINMVPNGDDDQNLQVIANANRVANGKVSANDIISLVIAYPDGRTASLSGGKLISAPPGNSITNNGRLKSKAYAFMFEKVSGT